eukprot:augustus_masked-scaffold_71-processed-gene-0.56-mRNA-1 protein AED:1.00 eAED:1.00 QI:0/0/0/0/1/1/3/0/525
MKLHFLRMATWGIVTGARTVPEDTKELEKFERQAAGAFSDLVRYVGGDLEDLCLMFESLQEAWKELQLVCVTSEDVKLQEAERELEQLEAGPDVLLTVTKFKALKLFSLLPAEFNELVLNIRTEKMFRSDDNSYDMEKILVKVMQRATVLSSLRDTRAVLKAQVTNAAPAKQSIKKKKCPICMKEGHLKFRCPCRWNCKKTDHNSFDCPNKKKEQVKKVCSTKEKVDLSGLAEIVDETKTHKLVAKRGQNKLYWLSFTVKTNVVKLGSTPDTTMEWHRKLGHPSYQTMMEMQNHGLVDGLPKERLKKWNQCLECDLGKLSEKMIPGTTKVHKFKATRRFEKVHADLVGLLPTGKGGLRFMLTLVDDYTKYKWTFCIRKKSQVTEVIKAWLKRMNNLTSRKLINFKTDQGNEFVNSSLKEEFENLGVVHDVSPKYHPSMNGTVERWNRTLQDGYKVLLIDSGLTADYWPYAAECFTYLHKGQFSRVTPEAKTPFELMYLRKPQVDHLFEFGRLGAAGSIKQQKKGK